MSSQNTPPSKRTLEESWVYVLFLSVSLLLIALAIIFRQNDVAFSLLLNMSASVMVVVVVEYIWRTKGGDPITRGIADLRTVIRQVSELERAGIASVKLKRDEVREQWLQHIRTATKIDLMALTLAAEFSQRQETMDALRRAMQENNCRIRALTLRPTSQSAVKSQRIQEEECLLHAKGAGGRIEAALVTTWNQFANFPSPTGSKQHTAQPSALLQLAWTEHITIYSNIVRIDNIIWFSPYLASARGGESPMFQVVGSESPLFKLLEREFDHMWKQAHEEPQPSQALLLAPITPTQSPASPPPPP